MRSHGHRSPSVRRRTARPFGEHGDRRHAPFELGAHLAQRLDRDDIRAARQQKARQLPVRLRGRACASWPGSSFSTLLAIARAG